MATFATLDAMPTESTRPDPEAIAVLASRSVEIIRANQAPSGAYIASPNFVAYRYSWLRDGAFIADAMSRVGEIESAEAFFGWCAKVLVDRSPAIEALIARGERREEIPEQDFLNTRFTVDGIESDEDWREFQLDGYGTWLWAFDAHRRRHGRPLEDLLTGAALSARYVAAFHDRPTYDWWEEFEDLHGSTLGSLFGGLVAAASWPELDAERRATFGAAAGAIRDRLLADAARLGRFSKVLGGTVVDASLVTLATPFRLVAPDDPRMAATLAEVERTLVVGAGVHRHPDDIYFGGGQWILLAAFLGWHYAELGRTADAWTELGWIAAHADEDGALPEQVGDHLLAPDHLGDWPIPVARPLLWSHAMFLTLAAALDALA
jgi:GH15 family glucan-1,4-alpha-glucosidase